MPGVFDIIGPVMIGPSSSHTAGAAKLGRMARTILGEAPVKALVKLHGSFAKTYQGHGTDKAIAAGLLGFAADDRRLKEALAIAPATGLKINFTTVNLGDTHPNTAVFFLTGASGRTVKVVGSSIGGGNIIIREIDGYQVEMTGQYNTLISIHRDKPGIVAMVTQILAQEQINIAFMQVSRRQRGAQALMVIEIDQPAPPSMLTEIRSSPAINLALSIPPL